MKFTRYEEMKYKTGRDEIQAGVCNLPQKAESTASPV